MLLGSLEVKSTRSKTSTRSAIAARHLGDKYQAYVFWLQALKLLAPNTAVKAVAIEFPEADHFDDVVLYYENKLDDSGQPLHADCFQVKFKVVGGEVDLTYLTDPSAIYSRTTSLLQRLNIAHLQQKQLGRSIRFTLMCPMRLGDDLLPFYDNSNSSLAVGRMLKDSAGKKILEQVRAHLTLETLEEAALLLKVFRIQSRDEVHVRELLEKDLGARGLYSVGPDDAIEPYSQLAELIITKHQNSTFNLNELKTLLSTYNLYSPEAQEYCHTAIVSRPDGVQPVIDLCGFDPLDLRELFEGRRLSEGLTWDQSVIPRLKAWVNQIPVSRDGYALHLECQCSIAIAAGYFLGPNSGYVVHPMQKLGPDKQVWRRERLNARRRDLLISQELIDNRGADAALIVSLTHDIHEHATAYIRNHLPQVGRVCIFQPEGGSHSDSVLNAAHADELAEQIVAAGRNLNAQGPLHLFLAGPNSMAFFLGQRLRPLGQITVYEYDLDNRVPGIYFPGVTLPPLSGMLAAGGVGDGAE